MADTSAFFLESYGAAHPLTISLGGNAGTGATSWNVKWGDGTTDTVGPQPDDSLSAFHTYADGGAAEYEIRVTGMAGGVEFTTVKLHVFDDFNVAAPNVRVGTNDADFMAGGSDTDNFKAKGGDDWFWGNDGDDFANGGLGADNLRGGNGKDKLDGFVGEDTLYGDEGNDKLDAGSENDTVFGGNGNDTIDGGDGDDVLGDTCGKPHDDHCAILARSFRAPLSRASTIRVLEFS